jgi:hypothetical protein
MLVTLDSGVLLYSNRDAASSWNNTRTWTFKKKSKDTFTIAAQQLTARMYVSAMNNGTKVCSWKEKDPNLSSMVVVDMPAAAACRIHCAEIFTRIFVVVQADSGVLLLSNELKIVSECQSDQPKAKVVWTELVRDVLLVLRVVGGGKKEKYELLVFHVTEGRKNASKVTKMGSHTLTRPAEAGKEKSSGASMKAPRLTFHAQKCMLSVVWGGEWWQLLRFDSRLQWYRSDPEHVSTRALDTTGSFEGDYFFAGALSDSYMLTCQSAEGADEGDDEDAGGSRLKVWDTAHGLFVPGSGDTTVQYDQPGAVMQDEDGAPIAVSINTSGDGSGGQSGIGQGLCEVAIVLEHAVLLSYVHAAPSTLYRALEMGRGGLGGKKRGREEASSADGANGMKMGPPPSSSVVPSGSLTAALRQYTDDGESGGATSAGGVTGMDVCVHVLVDHRKWEAEVMAKSEGEETRVLRQLLTPQAAGSKSKSKGDAVDDAEFVRAFEEYVGGEGEGGETERVLLSQRFVSSVAGACLDRAASAVAKASSTEEDVLLPLQPLHSLLQSEQVSVQQVPHLVSSLLALGQAKTKKAKGAKASAKAKGGAKGAAGVPSLLISCLHLVADVPENTFVDVLRFLFGKAEEGALVALPAAGVGATDLGRGKKRQGDKQTEEEEAKEEEGGRIEGDVDALQLLPFKTAADAAPAKRQRTTKSKSSGAAATAATAAAAATANALEQHLACVVSAPKTTAFLRTSLRKLNWEEVQLVLVYLKRWLFEYKHRLPSNAKYNRAGDHSSKQPSLAQVHFTPRHAHCAVRPHHSLTPPLAHPYPTPSCHFPLLYHATYPYSIMPLTPTPSCHFPLLYHATYPYSIMPLTPSLSRSRCWIGWASSSTHT